MVANRAYDSSNRLLTLFHGERFHGADLDGRWRSVVFGGNTYTYDSLMPLAKVTNSTGIYLFSYDPLGRRVKKVDENTSGTVLATYTYHYEESQVVVEYQRSSVTWTYYLGIGIDQDAMRVYGTTTQWYYHDALGSVGTVADHSGNVLEKYEYNGQGQYQITNASGTVLTTTAVSNYIMFTGRELDNETGNYFYRARYYNPTLGRFISRDPLSGAEFSQGTNLYAYCQNDPIDLVDPTGTDGTQYGVTATVFSTQNDPDNNGQLPAYTNQPIDDNSTQGVALPSSGLGGQYVQVTDPDTGNTVVVPVIDIGPGSTNDPYWTNNSSSSSNQTSGAGIDLTPATARSLGILVGIVKTKQGPTWETLGKKTPKVNWKFVPKPKKKCKG